MKIANFSALTRFVDQVPTKLTAPNKPKRAILRARVDPFSVSPLWLASRAFIKREATISCIAKTPRIAHAGQRLELLSRIQKRHEGLTVKHETLKFQASRNFDATRQPQYLQAAKEHHAAMIGHRSLADHARKEWIWLYTKGVK